MCTRTRHFGSKEGMFSTHVISLTSRPREATSVATRTRTSPVLKSSNACSLSHCSLAKTNTSHSISLNRISLPQSTLVGRLHCFVCMTYSRIFNWVTFNTEPNSIRLTCNIIIKTVILSQIYISVVSFSFPRLLPVLLLPFIACIVLPPPYWSLLLLPALRLFQHCPRF